MAASRQYDLVVFGLGYTGKLTAEHIASHLPTDLRWALAGRSASKLELVAAECKSINPDRTQPAIEVCGLNDEELGALAKKTTILIATVGPYALYGEYAFKACAENGTHYLDVTGEVAYVLKMIKKYESVAKASGSIMIPQIGLDSAPADLIAWKLVTMIREKFSAPTGEVVLSVHELIAKPSGGTLASVFALLDVFTIQEVSAAGAPFALSPIPGPSIPDPRSWIVKLFGIRVVPDLGILTTSFAGMTDPPIVQRSWGLLGGASFYGPNFRFEQYAKSRNHLTAVLTHLGLTVASVCLAIPFVRQTLRKYVYQPGDGPTKEESKNDRVEYRGIATPDVATPKTARAFCRAYFKGSPYAFTGVSVGQAALSILRDNHELTGGIYTPATLGQKFLDRLQSVGFNVETKIFE